METLPVLKAKDQPIFCQAVEAGTITVKDSKGNDVTLEYCIAESPGMSHPDGSFQGGLNGYVFFPKRPTKEKDYGGILTYVPVHGGITYAREYAGGIVYGFDTMHYDSHEYPIQDREWIRGQMKVMATAILVAASVEKKYLRCVSNKGRAKYAQMVQDVGEPEQRQNFGVSINLLTGEL